MGSIALAKADRIKQLRDGCSRPVEGAPAYQLVGGDGGVHQSPRVQCAVAG